jgi:hypothetical protein
VSDAVDAAADELYGLPLDLFVPRRDELARGLRAAGDRDGADAVKRLPKPSVPAWVVNRLARERPDDVSALLQAGDELRSVQEWLLRREADPGDLRAAVESERDAVAQLVHAGADLLTEAGRAPRGDVLERIGETLHAAAADAEIRDDVVRGRVVRDRAVVGLGAMVGATPAGATRRASRGRAAAEPEARPARRGRRGSHSGPEAAAEAEAARERERREAAAAALEELRAAEAEAKAAERMRNAADQAVDRALRALDVAEDTWNRAGEDLRAAREELAAAQKAARNARDAAEVAEAEVVDRRRRADKTDAAD